MASPPLKEDSKEEEPREEPSAKRQRSELSEQGVLKLSFSEVQQLGKKEVQSWATAVLKSAGCDDGDVESALKALNEGRVRGSSLETPSAAQIATSGVPPGLAAILHRKLDELRQQAVAPGSTVLAKAEVMPITDKLCNTKYTVPELLALKGTLGLPESVHAEPRPIKFVERQSEAKCFIDIVKIMREQMVKDGRLDKRGSLLLEYATMSGAGKSRWGFEVARLLERVYRNTGTMVRRVGLNFNGGTGGGSADKVAGEALALQLGPDEAMATLLLARGLLRCSPEKLRGAEKWLKGLSARLVIDALFEQQRVLLEQDTGNAACGMKMILVVHVDELTLFEPKFPGVDWHRALKDFVNTLADYNCSEDPGSENPNPKGLIVPVITHTAPVLWAPNPTQIELKAQTLPPMTFDQSFRFFDTENIRQVDIDLCGLPMRRLISACGGHPALLIELSDKLLDGATLGTLFTLTTVLLHKAALKNMETELCCELVRLAMQQQVVKVSDYHGAMQRGVMYLTFFQEETRAECRISMPYPMMVNMLVAVDADTYRGLIPSRVPASSNEWSSLAFEIVCAIRVAVDIGGIRDPPPFVGRSDMSIIDMAMKYKKTQTNICFLSPQGEKEVDSVGFHSGCMTLIQSKYPEKDGKQEAAEVRSFIDFVQKFAVAWAKEAGCSHIHAIFATGRQAPNFTACPAPNPELELDSTKLSFTLYAKNQNTPRDGQMQSQAIEKWLPPGVMCF